MRFRVRFRPHRPAASLVVAAWTLRLVRGCGTLLPNQGTLREAACHTSAQDVTSVCAAIVDGGVVLCTIDCCSQTPAPTHPPTLPPITQPPSPVPTRAPVPTPTEVPTQRPTQDPTEIPTALPSTRPTPSPSTQIPTEAPTKSPTGKPSSPPTDAPTPTPTFPPTERPTPLPSPVPTVIPTIRPSTTPTIKPTAAPTCVPTAAPSPSPTAVPSLRPTNTPTAVPTDPHTTPTAATSHNPLENQRNAWQKFAQDLRVTAEIATVILVLLICTVVAFCCYKGRRCILSVKRRRGRNRIAAMESFVISAENTMFINDENGHVGQYRVFITYNARESKDEFTTLHGTLVGANYSVFVTTTDMDVATTARMQREVRESDIVIAVLSPRFFHSKYTCAEVSAAQEENIPIIPVYNSSKYGVDVNNEVIHWKNEETEHSDTQLRNYVYKGQLVEVHNMQDPTNAAERLLDAVANRLEPR